MLIDDLMDEIYGPMQKAAAGKIMKVSYTGLQVQGESASRSGVVFMPDCTVYRMILGGKSKSRKASLIGKFVMPRLAGSCDTVGETKIV